MQTHTPGYIYAQSYKYTKIRRRRDIMSTVEGPPAVAARMSPASARPKPRTPWPAQG